MTNLSKKIMSLLVFSLCAASPVLAVSKKKQQQFLKDAANGSTQKVQKALDRGMPLDLRNQNGRTALHIATTSIRPRTALLLLKRGASPHAIDKHGHTPLHLAVDRSTEISKMLLQFGANPYIRNMCKQTVIHAAAEGLEPQILKTIIGEGCDIEKRDIKGKTSLQHAADDPISCAFATTKLLDAGADISESHQADWHCW